jgi:transposase
MKMMKLSKGRKGQKGSSKHDISFRRHVAQTYVDGDQSLSQLGQIFGLPPQTISRWAKQFSSELAAEQMTTSMTEQEEKEYKLLKKQHEALKKKLEYEQMKNFALETMVDLAKSELGIDLRKNSGAKQPKE